VDWKGGGGKVFEKEARDMGGKQELIPIRKRGERKRIGGQAEGKGPFLKPKGGGSPVSKGGKPLSHWRLERNLTSREDRRGVIEENIIFL